jgi:hypothetical protein
MTTTSEPKGEALGTFHRSAENENRPVDPAPHKGGDLKAEQKDAADILHGNATGDKKRVDAAIADEAKRDKRAG